MEDDLGSEIMDVILSRHFLPVLALYPSSGTSPAFLSHTYGSYEAPTIPSAPTEEVLLWCPVPARGPCCAAFTEAHKKEGQGAVLVLSVCSLLWLLLPSRCVSVPCC